MANTEQEVFERADATIAVAGTLKEGDSAYEWDELTNADFAAKIAAARAMRLTADAKKVDYDAQRGGVNARFDDLEARKIQAIGMAKYRFRKDAGVMAMLESLGEYGGARGHPARSRRMERGVAQHRPELESAGEQHPGGFRGAQGGVRGGAKGAHRPQIRRAQSGHRPAREARRNRGFERDLVWRRHARLSDGHDGRRFGALANPNF